MSFSAAAFAAPGATLSAACGLASAPGPGALSSPGASYVAYRISAPARRSVFISSSGRPLDAPSRFPSATNDWNATRTCLAIPALAASFSFSRSTSAPAGNLIDGSGTPAAL